MSVGVRSILILFSVLTIVFIIKKIRQSKLQIEYSLFWIGFSIFLILISVFPQIVYWFTDLIGIQSPVNFVFLVIIFILIMKNFMMTIELSQLENKVKELVQELVVNSKMSEECVSEEKK